MADDLARDGAPLACPSREATLEDVHVVVPVAHQRPGRSERSVGAPVVHEHDRVIVADAETAHRDRQLWRRDDAAVVVEEDGTHVERHGPRHMAARVEGGDGALRGTSVEIVGLTDVSGHYHHRLAGRLGGGE